MDGKLAEQKQPLFLVASATKLTSLVGWHHLQQGLPGGLKSNRTGISYWTVTSTLF